MNVKYAVILKKTKMIPSFNAINARTVFTCPVIQYRKLQMEGCGFVMYVVIIPEKMRGLTAFFVLLRVVL